MKRLLTLILLCLFGFLLLEVSLAIYVYAGEIKVELPTYSMDNTQSFWYDLNGDFGTWHIPNDSYRQKKECFDVTYSSNSHGFRDVERETKFMGKRVVTLGDSFVEGLGVQLEDRLTNQLEVLSNIPHLNFGLAGNFGPTQYAKLYESYASKFDHDAILVGILPSNDFIDDDYKINKKIGSNRYRPFWVGEYPDYQLFYFQDSLHKSSVNKQDLKPFKQVLKNFTYSYNVLLYFKTLWNQRIYMQEENQNKFVVPSYFEFNEAQLNRLIYSLSHIKNYGQEKKMLVFTIPTLEEILEFQQNKINPLGEKLKLFCSKNGIIYVDLLEHFQGISKEEAQKLFLSCDGHWSEYGNTQASLLIHDAFNYYQN